MIKEIKTRKYKTLRHVLESVTSLISISRFISETMEDRARATLEGE